MIHKNSADFTFQALEKSRTIGQTQFFINIHFQPIRIEYLCLVFASETSIKSLSPAFFLFHIPSSIFTESSSLRESELMTQDQINCFLLIPDPSRKITIFKKFRMFLIASQKILKCPVFDFGFSLWVGDLPYHRSRKVELAKFSRSKAEN